MKRILPIIAAVLLTALACSQKPKVERMLRTKSPAPPTSQPWRLLADMDRNGLVDANDYALFARCYNGDRRPTCDGPTLMDVSTYYTAVDPAFRAELCRAITSTVWTMDLRQTLTHPYHVAIEIQIVNVGTFRFAGTEDVTGIVKLVGSQVK